jgi:hypothetical protein
VVNSVPLALKTAFDVGGGILIVFYEEYAHVRRVTRTLETAPTPYTQNTALAITGPG